MSESTRFTRSGGNIFADLDLEDADELLPKSQIAWRIATVIRDRGLSQVEAAAEFGVDQPRISDVMNGRLDRFSLDWLLNLANAAGLDVVMTIAPVAEPARKGRTFVAYAPDTPDLVAT